MRRTLKDIIVGFIAFTVLAILISWLTGIGWLIPQQVINWLKNSPNPQVALYSFGALSSAMILGLLRLGLVFPQFKNFVPEDAMRYVAGLPLWLVLVFVIASSLALATAFPSCQTPGSVLFEIPGREPMHPSETLTPRPGETLLVKAQPIEKDVRLHCKWQYTGNAFQTLGGLEGCDIEITFSPRPGNGVLTLMASYDFCNQSNLFSIPVSVQEP